jgi:hypothetical protein
MIVKRSGPTFWQRAATPWRLHAGVMISVVDSGLLLSQVFLFRLLCPPIYLPFAEMTISPTSWALWSEPVAIRMRQLPDTDIILGQDAAQWLREKFDQSPV